MCSTAIPADPESGILTIKESEIPEYCKKYDCDTFQQLDHLMWYEYGVEIRVVK